MQLTGTLHIQGLTGESETLERLEIEATRVQCLSDEAIEALGPIIDAVDSLDVVRKLHRFVAALVSPAMVLSRIFARDPAGFTRFCLQLSCYRSFVDHLERGATPREAATTVERARRAWLHRELRIHDIADEDMYEGAPADVYDAEGELDPGAVRAEIERLLRCLNVPPERIGITVLPAEHEPPAPPDQPVG